MGVFTLDTSGAVIMRAPLISTPIRKHVWSDLNAFTQGYVEALMQAIEWPDHAEGFGPSSSVVHFDWLAPEALALILRDCELAKRALNANQCDGPWFWDFRQRNNSPVFPPLNPYLREDGKVALREAK